MLIRLQPRDLDTHMTTNRNLRKETRSLRDKGERLDKKEQEAMDEMQTADELLSEGTSKLQAALSSGSKVDSQVACLMIERPNQIKSGKGKGEA